jgi:hypothetical protein
MVRAHALVPACRVVAQSRRLYVHRSGERLLAGGPTDSCPLPQRVIRGHAATRCRLIAVSCDFLTRGAGRVGRAAGPNP